MDATLSDPLVGRVLDGRYVVESRIARGGMATVYLAVDRRLEREVALKVMHAGLAGDEDFVRRFIREARSAARLSHPHVVAVYDQGEDDGTVFLAMEHVPGRTLRDLVAERERLTPREAFTVLDPVLDALAAAHRAGIVHRDVKPENVLLADDGRIKVADFGLARAVTAASAASSTGVLMGTVAYLSPEQVERGVADARSDVYAAGILLFEMLTGDKPFEGETAMQVAYRHVHDEVPPPSTRVTGIPPELDELVCAATARDPDERPEDAGELLDMLRRVRRDLAPEDLERRPVPIGATAAEAAAAGRSAPDDRTLVVDRDGLSAAGAAAGAPAAAPSSTRERFTRGRRGKVALVAVLVLALLLGVGGWYLGVGPGAYTDVPRVVGQSEQVARQRLAGAGLDVKVQQAYDEQVAAGRVVTSRPAEGQRVRKAGTVTLVVSRGPERYAVPKLQGLRLGAAKAALTAGHLAVGTVTQAYDATVQKGSVVSSDPGTGTRLRRDQAVALVVSKGRQPVSLRSWVGQPADQASAAITASGLKVTTTEAYDEKVPKGSVVSQEPGAGTAYKGDTVRLVVSKGPPLVQVPPVVGQQVDSATAALRAAGFQVQVRQVLGGFFGTVRIQDPSGGSMAPKGSVVTLTVV